MGASCSRAKVRTLEELSNSAPARSPIVSSFCSEPDAPHRRHPSAESVEWDLNEIFGEPARRGNRHNGHRNGPAVNEEDEEVSDYSDVPIETLPGLQNALPLGGVFVRNVQNWMREIPSPSELSAIPENEIWSDGEREARLWLESENNLANGDPRGPQYVSALTLRTPQNSTVFTVKRRKGQGRKLWRRR